MNNKTRSVTPKSEKSLKFVPISEEELIEAGMLVIKPKTKEAKAGSPVKELKMLEYDHKYLEELQLEAAKKHDNNHLPPKGFRKPVSGTNQRLSSSVYSMKRTSTISHRKSDANKNLAERTVKNIGKVLNKENVKNGDNKFIPRFQDLFDVEKNEGDKCRVRKTLFGKYTGSIKKEVKSSPRKYKTPSRTSSSPLTSARKLNKNTPLRLSTVKEERHSLTPSENGSTSTTIDSEDVEFEKMEKMCKLQELNEEIGYILNIIEKEHEDFAKYKKAHDEKMLEMSKRLKKIIAKVSTVEKSKVTKKTSIKSTSNDEDLRRSVLIMNSVKSQVETPKLEKAEKMYNSLRDQFGMLETPRFDKKIPPGEGNISLKLQEQCLMLLDTPQHK